MAKKLTLIILLWLAADVYFYQAVQTLVNSSAYLWAYWLIDLLLMGGIVAVIFVRRGARIQQTLITWLMGLMLLALVCIAALLVPLHHRVEKWATAKLVEKNKKIRLANAKKTIEQLEKDKTY